MTDNWDEANVAEHRAALLAELDRLSPASLERAVHRLNHDEHIDAALSGGILAAVTIVPPRVQIESEDGTPPLLAKIQQIYQERLAREVAQRGNSPSARSKREDASDQRIVVCRPHLLERAARSGMRDVTPASVLESSYLGPLLDCAADIAVERGLPSPLTEPVILDIDLDYFETPEALSPDDPTVLYDLIRRAEGITIATEPSFLSVGWLADGDPNPEDLVATLLEHTRRATGSG